MAKLLGELRDAQTSTEPDIQTGLDRGQQLREAVRSVGDSSSGSWVGWHSRMYFKEYDEPSVRDTFDSEWGGLHPLPDGWSERSQADVQRAVEQRAGTTLPELAHTADRVRERCKPLQQEVLTVLSPMCDLDGLDREAEMLGGMEDIDWITSPATYVQAMAPNQMMSRDSTAINQGMQPPLHINVEAAIVSNTQTLARSRDFLTDAIRLCRQIEAKLEATPAHPPRPTPAGPGGRIDQLERRLWRRTLALFSLLTAAVAGGVVAVLWRLVDDRLASAAIIVGAGLLISGLYALLIDRRHAILAMTVAGGVAGAVAAVYDLLG